MAVSASEPAQDDADGGLLAADLHRARQMLSKLPDGQPLSLSNGIPLGVKAVTRNQLNPSGLLQDDSRVDKPERRAHPHRRSAGFQYFGVAREDRHSGTDGRLRPD